MRHALALAVFLVGAGCGGGGGGSAPPTAPPVVVVSVPATPPGLTVGALVMKDRTAVLSWGASTGATEYIVEVGSAPGVIDGGIHSAGAATSLTLRDLRVGRSYVRVKARNSAGTSGASAESTFLLPDLREYIEALFLGGGPLIPDTPTDPNLSCPRRGMWSAFPRGTTVRNRASEQIPAQYRETIRAVLDQIPNATVGHLSTTFEVVAEGAPSLGENHMVHVALQSTAELQYACGSSGSACIAYNSPVERGGPFSGGQIRWSVGYYVAPTIQSTRPYAHEPGHGMLGMCHIHGDRIGGREQSLMSAGGAGVQPDRLTPFDIEALRAVYGSSVAIGAGRAEFVAAGLIKP